MNIAEFLSKCKISHKDKNICLSVYNGEEKEEAHWEKELTGRVDFSLKVSKNKKEEIKEMIEKKKKNSNNK